MKKELVPKDFLVPEILETDQFRLRMLRTDDVVKDYDAVISSINHLQKQRIFKHRGDNWPAKDLSFKQDLADLEWHEKEFQSRSSFAYTVMTLDETRCLGCVYIFPSLNQNYDVQVYMWVREDELKNGLDSILFDAVKGWLQISWPFKNISYPGREGAKSGI